MPPRLRSRHGYPSATPPRNGPHGVRTLPAKRGVASTTRSCNSRFENHPSARGVGADWRTGARWRVRRDFDRRRTGACPSTRVEIMSWGPPSADRASRRARPRASSSLRIGRAGGTPLLAHRFATRLRRGGYTPAPPPVGRARRSASCAAGDASAEMTIFEL